MRIALLAGGTGGAKLAAGMQEEIGSDLSVIANTGEDPEVHGIELDGIAEAEPTKEVLEALRSAEAIVIGPSNPVISIGPILAVPGMREAIRQFGVPVIAVSPFVAGQVVKGPTERFMQA